MAKRLDEVKKLIEYRCGACGLYFWIEEPSPLRILFCPKCGKSSYINEDNINIPIIGKIIPDKKLGNKIIYDKLQKKRKSSRKRLGQVS